MKKYFLLSLLTLFYFFSHAQMIINELEADAGNHEGTGGDWIEFKNIGINPEDMSCWSLTNGGSVALTFPAALIVPPGGYLLVGNAAKMMCSTCDYKSMASLFILNPDGFGPGSGAYANTIFLNTNVSASGGCGCLTGSGNFNNGAGTGDRVILFNDAHVVIDAMMYAGGNNYGNGPINVNFVGTSSCGIHSDTLRAVTDSIYIGRTICNDLSGCNSSFARLPDGNNGVVVTYDQSGNLGCTNCLAPCPTGAVNTASTDYPTPGLSNNLSTSEWSATFMGSPFIGHDTTITVCNVSPITFGYQINNYTNAALTATQGSGNLGSYVMTNSGTPVNFGTASYNSTTGVTTLSSTVTPPNGTTVYEFVWGDGNTNCTTCPGSNSTAIPTSPLSPNQECYVAKKVTVVRENSLSGTLSATCSLPGTITINGASGTNIQYTLQKQTSTSIVFLTVGVAQSSNIIGGIFDDDADPLFPNYQVLVSTVNTVCPNLAPIVVPIPNACLGNPACPVYVTSGTGVPTFTPASGYTVCANSSTQFTVSIQGVCTTGQVEVLYSYNPAFDPYTSGTSLGIAGTTVGTTPPATTATGKVFINEFAARPAQGSCIGTPDGPNPNSGEWLELFNAGPGNVDISGWIVSDGDWTATIPAGTILNNGLYYLIGGGGTFCSSNVVPDLNIETCNCTTVDAGSDIMNLTNTNEQLALFDCSGTYLDGVLWGVGQLPDLTTNNAPAAGCGNYIPAKTVVLPASASFAASGSIGSSPNSGKYRTSANTWTTSTFTTFTPRAANPGGNWNGVLAALGTQCPAPPVTSTLTVTLPDTCSQTSFTSLTLKAIYKPDPISPCTKSAVTAAATYVIPPCELLTLTGNGDYCAPSTAPVSISSSAPLTGVYSLNLSNGTNTVSINPATGAGPFNTTVSNSGAWTIASITPLSGVCPPKKTGIANININPFPVISSVPQNAFTCYQSGFDLSSLEPLIVSSPSTTHFNWYDSLTGGSQIFPYQTPLVSTTYYVAATTGFPSNCEEPTRTPVTISINPLPLDPIASCNGLTVTFIPLNPDCEPVSCLSGIEYSIDGVNWSAGPTFSYTDPGWAGFGSIANSVVYLRNASSPSCYKNVTYLLPCPVPLPADLVNFYGKLNEEESINLHWETAQEKNVSHFEIEKSTDKTNFRKLGTVSAIGNSAVSSAYDFIDKQPYYGSNYYRLKIVDIDQQYLYSNVIAIQSDVNQTRFEGLYPNPAHEYVTIEMNMAKTEKTIVQFIDAMGKYVIEIPVLFEKGLSIKKIDTRALAKGHYTLRIPLSNKIIVEQFVKD